MRAIKSSAGFAPVLCMAVLLLGVSALFLPQQQAQAAPSSIKITVSNVNTGKLAVARGAKYKLGAKSTKGTLRYKSSANKVASVSKKGTVKAKRPGKATVTITAKKGSVKKTRRVVVSVLSKRKYKQVRSIRCHVDKRSLLLNESTTIKVKFNPSKASNKNLRFASSDKLVVQVSATGRVRATKVGTAKITVSSAAQPKKKAVVTVRVYGAEKPMKITGDKDPIVKLKKDVRELDGVDYVTRGNTVTFDYVPGNLKTGDKVIVSSSANREDATAAIVTAMNGSTCTATTSGLEVLDFIDTLKAEGTAAEVAGVQSEAGSKLNGAIHAASVSKKDSVEGGTLSVESGDLKGSITPSVNYRFDISHGLVNEIYFAPSLRENLTISKSKSLVDESKKIGNVWLATKVPGLVFEIQIWLNASVDGSVSLSLTNTQTLGLHYSNKRLVPVSDEQFSWAADADISGDFSADVTGVADFMRMPLVDGSIVGGYSFDLSAAKRPSGMLCNDFSCGPFIAVALGKHESLLAGVLSTFSIEPEARVDLPQTVAVHFESGIRVSKCTWSDGDADRTDAQTSGDGNTGRTDIPSDARLFAGHHYSCFFGTYTWEEAKEACEKANGHLVTITSSAEQEFVVSIAEGSRLWIGGYRDNARNWRWVTGEAWSYTNWGAGEPNNSSNVVSDESCVAIWPRQWNDLANTNVYEQDGYVCEWDS